jgi:hypothetical protein
MHSITFLTSLLCFFMCSGTCTYDFWSFNCLICDFLQNCYFNNSVWIWIRICIRIQTFFPDSDLDPAKNFGFFRIRIHNTACNCSKLYYPSSTCQSSMCTVALGPSYVWKLCEELHGKIITNGYSMFLWFIQLTIFSPLLAA